MQKVELASSFLYYRAQALLPVLTSNGRGSDVMIPMAIPSFGGMLVELLTLFLVPVLYSAREEWACRLRNWGKDKHGVRR